MERSLGVRKGAWTEEEDKLLRKFVEQYGEGRWYQVPSRAGLKRCRKSCRLRWLNYLKPDIKRGKFAADEVDLMIRLHNLLGNRWSLIAGRLPGRTANDVKNYWNTSLRQKMVSSNKDVKSKPEPKSITKANIIKPRPWNFKNLSKRLRGNYGTAFINVGPQVAEDLCKPSTMALPPSENENERGWWETLLEDREISLTDKDSRLGYGFEVHRDPINSLFLEENAPAGGTRDGDIFCEQGQTCWSDASFDADLWNLINTEQDQQPIERI